MAAESCQHCPPHPPTHPPTHTSRLRTLYLIHVDELDLRALSALSADCADLETLGLYNCIFREIVGEEEDDDYADRARLACGDP